MTSHYPSFLVAPSGSVPRTLLGSIRDVGNASAGFCRSWRAKDLESAGATSEEAFSYLDHIQNELLRHRDEKSKQAGWDKSPYFSVLSTPVGKLLQPASEDDKAAFVSRKTGEGQMPEHSAEPLSLNDALNKLKHRATNLVNFAISADGAHELFIFTTAGMGKPDSISTFDVETFCRACKEAAGLL